MAAPTPTPLELESHRPQLFRFAMLQLRNESTAEDAVQETLVAALQGVSGFAGQSSVRTWLIGILKHKIIDHLRRAGRERPLSEVLPAEESDSSDFDALFAADGHWAESPSNWGNPDQALQQGRFFQALERCLQGLPKKTGQAFMMREVMGLETTEICKELRISSSNCWVMLYRARMSLRLCLEQNWMDTPAVSKKS
jgi:RNA polymerase sigma-70 factor (ECF subfamily)